MIIYNHIVDVCDVLSVWNSVSKFSGVNVGVREVFAVNLTSG